MTLGKTGTKLFDAITIPAKSYSSPSSVFNLTDAIKLSVGYTMTFAANAELGATIFLYGDPSFNNSSFVAGIHDDPADSASIEVDAGNTVSSTLFMEDSPSYARIRIYNHDNSASITNCSIWIAPQKL